MTIHALLPVVALITTVDLAPEPVKWAGPDAPVPQAPGWQAWHGCWELTGDGVPADRLVCMLPGASTSDVRLVNVTGGFVTGESVIRADGTPRAMEEGGCTGHEVAQWSQDGRRVFLRAELDCDGFRRVTSGIIAMVSEREWVDIRAATIMDQHLARTQRYRAVPADRAPEALRPLLDEARPMALQTARFVAAMPMGMAEVVEASRRMPTPAVQALLAARGDRLGINGRNLVQLADAGVPAEVIEVMVALAYPDHFNVRQPALPNPLDVAAPPRVASRTYECYDPYTRRWVYGRSCDDRYGYGRYGFGPWDTWGTSWGYGGWAGGGYVGGGTVIIVEPRQPERQPELVRGAGYTRGSADARGTATPRSGAPGSSPTGAASSTSTGTSTGSSGAGSSTSTGDSPTRTAVPRTGGGGE
jgi:hypothetical protein